jgi:hypothetical protein
MRKTAKFLVHYRNQVIQSLFVADLPAIQELGYVIEWKLGRSHTPPKGKRLKNIAGDRSIKRETHHTSKPVSSSTALFGSLLIE